MNTIRLSQSLRRLPRSQPCIHYTTSSSLETTTRDKLRALLRETAQPVAVVTSFMPPAASSESGNNGHVSLKFHGATLSSFTSIAMEPHPIVTFALRLPSRMATALHDAQAEKPSHMVINLLSAEQAPLAVAFSRPNVHADPFAELNYTLSEEGLPVLGGSLGALSCKLVAPPVPLHDLEFLEKLGKSGNESRCRPIQPHHGVTSELFIARVVRVESLSLRQEGEEDTPRTLPLLYHRRGYTTSQELHRYTKSPLPQPKS